MKTKNYSKDTSFSGKNIIIIFFLLISIVMHSQVRVNFTPRKPIASPSTSIYNIKGDFTLIGNTNLTLNNYDVNEPNSNNNMIYVDIDGDSNTFNSSSANLTFSTENGAIPECSKVVFAGLYWTGRSSDGSNSPDIFNVTKNSVTKTFNKRKVKLKGPTSSSYTEITANTNDIYYPQNSDGFMYSAFAEITEYVKANGIGKYTVADIALVEGNGGSTGYYGGWGIIVVYENSKMKWRDVTVFDGHAYVQGNSTSSHQIPISGFNAVQTGQVNVKLGLMAGEGDRSISGDYFNIQRSSDNNWQALNHTGNSTNNFFNSSIQTGGNTRNPNLVNNTGLDISMFNIPNPSNSVITNNQTSTTLRYGSTQDTYVIFMAAMAVDAYIPDPEGVMSLVTINGVPATSTTTVTPGQEIEYSIKILNEGTENINNAQIKIQLPYTATFVNGSQNGVINFSPLPTPNNIYFNPNDGPSGTLIWDIGTLPVPATPTTVLGELKYKIKITEDCFLLKNQNCVPSASLFGYINGIGAITGIQIINKPFIQGYVTSGLCIGDPILNPITTMIDATNFINQNCQNTITELVFNYCSPISQVPFNSIASNYPIGTQFYNSYPVNGSTIEYTNSNPFPNTLGSFNYYAVPPNANGCYYTLKINIVGSPTITSPQSVNINGCNSSAITPLVYSETPVNISLQDFINAGGNVSNNSLSYTISYVDVITGSCPIVINRSYTLTTSCVTTNLTQVFTIERPDFTLPANTASTVACAADIVAPSVPVVTDNCGNVLVASAPSISASPTCEGNVTYTYTFTDCEGNTHNWIHTFTIEHSDFTLPANTTSTVACAADIVAPSVPVVTDNCGNVLVASAPSISASPTCEGNVTYTYTFTDCEGNTHNWIHTFTIEHSDFTLPANTSSTVACAADIVAPSVPVVTDNCGNVLVASAPSISASPTCEGNVTYTYTFTDCEGNTHNWIHTFTIEHSDFTLPANTSSTVACAADIVAPSVPVVTDNCGNVLVASAPSISASPTCEGNVTYTYTFTDCEGNSHNWIHTFTIEHSDFTLPANTSSTVACAADIVAPSVPVVTDNCGNVLVASAPSISASPTCEGNVTYTYTFTDCEGNSHNWIHTFTIEHSDFTLPANTSSTVACAADIVAPSVPVVTDNCGNVLVASAPSISASPTCEGNVTYTYTFTDCEGNSHNWIHTFTIEHSDFTLPANTSSTVACAADIVAPSVPVVTDNCGNVLVASAPSISASPTCEGNVTYTYTFTDCEGNTHNWIHTFTIEHSDFTLPANTSSTVACAADIVAPSVPVVTDNCGNVLVASAPSISASPTCEGNVTYTYTFTDCEGNTHNWIHTFTIEHSDFTLPANTSSTVACAADIVAPSVPVVTDNCGNVLVASAPSISANPTCEGNVTYTYTFTDCEGNAHNWIHTFTIEHSDFTLPANTSSTVACAADIVAPSVPVVTDNCGNVLVASAPSISASPTCEGNVTYTYTFTDCEGNSHNWIHTFTIEHSDFTLPANTSSTVACAADIVAPSVPVVTDNCGNVLVASAPSISASPTCEGNVTYTYTFTDCEGNSHNWIHTFTIEHSDFTLPANTSSTVACAADIVAPSVPVVTDNCGNVLVASAPSISASPTCEGNVTYTYTFTDCEGNSHNWIHTFTIEHSDFTLPANTSSTVACAADIVAPSVPVVTDNCGNVLVASAPSISANPTCEGNVTYTYTFTDCEGNAHNWIHTFTIEHSDFTLPANTSSTVACAADIVAPSVPVVTDNCGNVLVASAPSISASPTCEGNVTYTYTFTDCEGNSHNWIHTFTIEHSDFTLPANTSSTVACAADIVAPSVPVVTDNCGNVLVASAPSISASPTCEGNVTYTYTFTDCEGNTHNWIHTFTIEHSDFTLPANTTSTVACAADIVAPSVPVVTDNCGNVLVASAPVISTAPTCEGNVTYTYTFTDCEGNAHNWVHTFTIEHNDFTLPANTTSTVACAADIVAPSVPVVTDNCGNVLVASAPVISTAPTCEGNVTYTYTFTDCEGNAHNWVHTFTIEHSDFTLPANTTSTVACAADIVAPSVPVVTDNCGNVLVASAPSISASPTCEGNVTYTYTFTDCEGNSHNWIHTFTIEHSDFTLPANTSSTVACAADIVAPSVPVVTDNCGNVLVASAPSISASPTCEGNVTYTYTFTDCEGNTHNWIHTFTIEHSDFTLPANTSSTVACAADIVAPSVPVVTDNCGNVLVASAPSISASPTCEGNVTYTYTFTDCEGNTHNWIHTFTIEHSDFTLPANTTSTVACAADIVAPSVPVVTDNCGNVLVASAPSISASPTCEGNVTYTYTFTDCEGNTHNWIHTFTIEHSDFTLPANTSSTVACAADIVAPSVPVVTDNCGNVLVASAPSISASPTCEGNVTYTYTFTDCEGNTHNWIHTFTIEHSDFTLPANTSSTVACAADIVAPSVPVVTDNCGNVLVASAPSISANPTCEGNVTYTYTFTDCEGNSHNWIHTFTIEHSDFTLPANTSSTVACAADIVAPSVPVVTDNCGNVLVASAPSISASPTCEGNVTYTYTFTDCEGNTHNWIHTFTIDDTSPPTGIAPSDILDLQCTSEIPVADINLVTDVADNCNGTVTVTVSETNNEGSGCNGNPLIITRTYTLTDCSGLTTNLIQTIRVEDNTAPIFTSELPQDISVSCDAIPNPAEMTGSDNCSDVTITVLDTIDREESQCEGEYIIRRTWTITDSCNNSSSYTQTITVFDNTPPTLTTPLDSQINVLCSEIPEIPQLVFTDNCSGIQDVVYNETSTIISIYAYVIVREWVVSDNCGNEANFTQTINVSVEEPFDAIPFAICIEENPIDLFTILDDSIPTNGTWVEVTNSGGLTGSIFNPSNVTLGYYTLRYIVELEDNACPMIYEIYLNVNDDCVVLPACDITVYNAVSPNDDSSNDFFFIDGLECYPDNTVEIYNRWGILVYDERGYDNNLKSFKGISEGKNTINKNELLPDGTYFYILKYTDEENKNHDRSGYLYLNR